MNSGPVVAIIGGGFTGAAVAYHLARLRAASAPAILVIEPRERLGSGLAYSTREPAHRINVPATRMSLDTSEPDQFSRWLDATGASRDDPASLDAGGGAFPQRGVFGRYVAAMLDPLLAEGRVLHRRDKAIGARRLEDGRFEIALASSGEVRADILVIATTHPLPAVPHALHPIKDAPGFIADPYDPKALAGIEPKARVLVVGNGLTAADTVATLGRLGHRGPITTVSRNGLRSRGHASVPTEPYGDFTAPPARTALELLRRIRQAISAAAGEGLSWHGVLDAVRIAGQDIWRDLSESERARIVRHLRSFWDVHRFRIAPQVEAVLDRLTAQGRLVSLAASLRSSTPSPHRLDVEFRRRRTAASERQSFDAVVNTTGPAHRSIVAQEPVHSLHQAGLAMLDRVGLGLATARSGQALDRDGQAVPRLFIAGPLARGTFGELMGLPQVTDYAEFIARQVAGELTDFTTKENGRTGKPRAADKELTTPGLIAGSILGDQALPTR
ncbi:FAD/NAD(P)-binding protein [Aureimonas psammosilenae]|uniref:FAD/NAD(P)-binding protein n=1 Tax=Aureimonas psammosilenae TaxID=2495496 RepID=UPI001F3DA991|nr:FAD/NAD(P)-binding protein [Aureimonas psammosilenae]